MRLSYTAATACLSLLLLLPVAAGHLALAPSMLDALDDADLDIPLIIGGIIPDADIPVLEGAGVAAILGPGAPAEEVVTAVRNAVAART